MTPLVIAHRGACWNAPENTLEAFELAIEEGADYVEFDVRDRDGELVVATTPIRLPEARRSRRLSACSAGASASPSS